jgi:hypothetical protein
MTPQGQLLTLKGPLFSGPVVTVSPALLEADLKPQVTSNTVAQSGIWCPLWVVRKKLSPDQGLVPHIFNSVNLGG